MTSRTEYNTQTPNKPSLFDVQYLRNHRTLDIDVLGYIGIVWPKEHSPEVRSFPPGTPVYDISSLRVKMEVELVSGIADTWRWRNDYVMIETDCRHKFVLPFAWSFCESVWRLLSFFLSFSCFFLFFFFYFCSVVSLFLFPSFSYHSVYK